MTDPGEGIIELSCPQFIVPQIFANDANKVEHFKRALAMNVINTLPFDNEKKDHWENRVKGETRYCVGFNQQAGQYWCMVYFFVNGQIHQESYRKFAMFDNHDIRHVLIPMLV